MPPHRHSKASTGQRGTFASGKNVRSPIQAARAAARLSASQLAHRLHRGSESEEQPTAENAGPIRASESSPDDKEDVTQRVSISTYTLSASASLKAATQVDVSLTIAPALTISEQQAIFEIFEANMRPLYEANQSSTDGPGGWDPPAKREELFHRDSRFLLVTKGIPTEASLDPRDIIAFAMFRFDIEPCHPQDPANSDRRAMRRYSPAAAKAAKQIEVVYLYELQVAVAGRSLGLGSALMNLLLQLAAAVEMRKVCLTTFRNNHAATAFYAKLGWKVDLTSPAESEGIPWEILSRSVVQRR